MQGVVKCVKPDKGYGFIRLKTKEAVFFHKYDTDSSLPFDETLLWRDVQFDVVKDGERERAVNVKAL